MAVGVTNISLQSHPLDGFVFLLLSKKLINLKFYSTGLPVVVTLQTPFIPLVVQAEEDEKQERIPAGSAVGPLFLLFRCSHYSPSHS